MDTQRVEPTQINKQWKSVHRQSLNTLIKLEIAALTDLRSVVRSSAADVSDELAQIPEASVRTDGMRIVRNAAARLQHDLFVSLTKSKSRARLAALDQVDAELSQLRTELDLDGFDHDIGDPELSEHAEEDAAESEQAAASLRAVWTQIVVSMILKYDPESGKDISVQVLAVPRLLDKRLRRIATTEISRSYNRELSIGHNSIDKNKETVSTWAPLVLRRWDATLDSKVCDDCRSMDGEVTPIGMSFSGGREPGQEHPNCRCVDTVVYIPVPINRTKQ
jgi:hypothetical protein